MPALDSTSSLRDIEASYFDSISYAESGDSAKAAAFITAANMLLLRRPQRIRHGQSEIEFSAVLIAAQIKTATTWLNRANGNAGGVRFLGVGAGFRG